MDNDGEWPQKGIARRSRNRRELTAEMQIRITREMMRTTLTFGAASLAAGFHACTLRPSFVATGIRVCSVYLEAGSCIGPSSVAPR